MEKWNKWGWCLGSSPDQGEGPKHCVIWHHLTPLPGKRDSSLISKKQSGTTWLWSSQALQWAFLHMNHSSFLYTFLINIVAATVCFLISLMFPVNCSYLELWCLPFVHPVLLCGHLGWWGAQEGEKGSKRVTVWFGKSWGETKLWSTILKPRQMGKTSTKRDLKASQKGTMA